MQLPFELTKYHKTNTKWIWKKNGLIVTEEEFETIYYMYIYTSQCDLCNKEFKNTMDRQMEHNHTTGEFRNIVCRSCNMLKYDVKKQSNNTSGYKGISKLKRKSCKQGFIWIFNAYINGKRKTIKSSIDKEKLIEFANKWKNDNNYNT